MTKPRKHRSLYRQPDLFLTDQEEKESADWYAFSERVKAKKPIRESVPLSPDQSSRVALKDVASSPDRRGEVASIDVASRPERRGEDVASRPGSRPEDVANRLEVRGEDVPSRLDSRPEDVAKDVASGSESPDQSSRVAPKDVASRPEKRPEPPQETSRAASKDARQSPQKTWDSRHNRHELPPLAQKLSDDFLAHVVDVDRAPWLYIAENLTVIGFDGPAELRRLNLLLLWEGQRRSFWLLTEELWRKILTDAEDKLEFEFLTDNDKDRLFVALDPVLHYAMRQKWRTVENPDERDARHKRRQNAAYAAASKTEWV